MLSASNLVGYLGAGVIAVAYFLTQRGVLSATDWRYPATNLTGSALIALSLVYHPNLPSLLIEAFWSAISLYGVVRALRHARASRRVPKSSL